MTQVKQMPCRSVSACAVVGPHPGNTRRHTLVVDHHERKTLLMQPGEMLGRLARKHCQQTSSQPGSQDAVDHIPLVLLVAILLARNAIEKKLIRGLYHHLRDTAHDLWDQRPRQRRDQDANQSAASTSQTGGRDAGQECPFFHDTQDALTCGRIHIWLLVQYPRNSSF